MKRRKKTARREGTRCSFSGCERDSRAKGLCDGHRKQLARGIALRPLVTVGGRVELERMTVRIPAKAMVKLRAVASGRGISRYAAAAALLTGALAKLP